MMIEDLPAGARLLAEKLRATLPDGEGTVRLSDVVPEMASATAKRHLRRLREAGVLSVSARGRAGVHVALGDPVSSDPVSSDPVSGDPVSDQDHHEQEEESRTTMSKPMPLNRQARRAQSKGRAAQVKAFYAEAAPLIGRVFDGPLALDGLPKITPDLLAAMTRSELATLWAVTSWAQVGHDDSRAVCDTWGVPYNPVVDFYWHDPLYEALSVAGVSYATTTADDLLPYWQVAS